MKMAQRQTFMVSLNKELFNALKKRAKKDKLTIQELINLILWRSAKTSLKDSSGRDKYATDFMKTFSRHKPIHEVSYYCRVCRKNHKYKSEIGKKHYRYKKNGC